MPDVIEDVMARYGRKPSEFYNLTRLEPAYRIIFPGKANVTDVPGSLPGIMEWAAKLEPESTESLKAFFDEAKEKYDKGVKEWIWKPMVSFVELLDHDLARAALQYNMCDTSPVRRPPPRRLTACCSASRSA